MMESTAVRDAVTVHRDIRTDLAASSPLWPLGLPGWSDPWLSLALRAGETTYLTVWHRGDPAAGAVLSLPHLAGLDVEIETLYPRHLPAFDHHFDPGTGQLTVTDPGTESVAARFIRIRSHGVPHS